jgi:hypothetical protein
MDPQSTLENPFVRILRNLGILRAFSPGLLDCALCGRRTADVHKAAMREDGAPLCQSCFALMLKKAAQTPHAERSSNDSLNVLDEEPASLQPGGWVI